MTYDLDPGRADYLATAIELGNNSLGNQSPTELVAEIAKAIRDCPNGARIVVEDMAGNRPELVERAIARFSGRNVFNAPHRQADTGKMGRLVGFIIPDEGALNEQNDDLRLLLSLVAPNQPLSDDVVERVFAEKIAAAESLMRIGPNERVRNTAKMSKAALEGALSEIRAAIAAIPSAGGVEERLRETLEGIHRLAERYTGISGTRSLHAAMHAISQAASAALGGGQ